MSSASTAVAHTSAERALADYRRRNRRLMRGYALALTAVVIVVLALVKLAYVRGELTKVSRRSSTAAAAVAPATTRAALTRKWQTTDHPATGSAYGDGIVVTFAGGTVNGRDATTGAVRWFYARRGQTICTVVQQDGSTIAIYRRGRNCDEVTGFTTATGVAKFYRTLQDDGTPAVTSAPNIVLVATPAAVHVFDNAGGIDRWRWLPPEGCLADRSLVGALGVLITYHCGSEQHLLLHTLTQKDETWNIKVSSTLVPFNADAFVGALNTSTGTVTAYSTDKGVVTGSFSVDRGPLAGQVSTPAAVTGLAVATPAVASNSLVLAGHLIAVGGPGRVLWTSGLTGSASLLSDGAAAVLQDGQVAEVATATGKILRRIGLSPSVGAGDAATAVQQIGDGLLVTGTGTAYYG